VDASGLTGESATNFFDRERDDDDEAAGAGAFVCFDDAAAVGFRRGFGCGSRCPLDFSLALPLVVLLLDTGFDGPARGWGSSSSDASDSLSSTTTAFRAFFLAASPALPLLRASPARELLASSMRGFFISPCADVSACVGAFFRFGALTFASIAGADLAPALAAEVDCPFST